MNSAGAIVLRGGMSRRMGRPKDRLLLGAETLLERVVRLLSRQASPIMVVSTVGQEPPELSAAVILAQDSAAGAGPLEGLAAGLRATPREVELVYATAVDSPFLAPGWIEALAVAIGDQDLAIPFALGRHHPLSAVYRRAPALAAAEALLIQGRRRVTDIVDVLRTRVVGECELRALDPALATLGNLNTPDDYRRALEELGPSAAGGSDVASFT